MKYIDTWPTGVWRIARKAWRCHYMIGGNRCNAIILPGESYFDPMESNPAIAGGFGGYRFCARHEDSAE